MLHPSSLSSGSVVAVEMPALGGFLPIKHFGIVTDIFDPIGCPTVVNASKRTMFILEEPWAAFSQRHPARIVEIPTDLDPAEILRRARSRIGQPYDLFGSNCEHFVFWALGYAPTSPQLRSALLAAGAGILVGLVLATPSGSR